MLNCSDEQQAACDRDFAALIRRCDIELNALGIIEQDICRRINVACDYFDRPHRAELQRRLRRFLEEAREKRQNVEDCRRALAELRTCGEYIDDTPDDAGAEVARD